MPGLSALNAVFISQTVVSAITLMMEAVSTSESSVNFYQTTRRSNSENSQLHSRCRENLSVFFVGVLFCFLLMYHNFLV
jgi:hypothetical protein